MTLTASVDIERCLLAAMIRGGDATEVFDARVTKEFFQDEENLAVWEWLCEHWERYSKVPDPLTLRRNYPTYKLPPTPEPLAHYLAEVRLCQKTRIAEDGVVRAADMLTERDVDGALIVMGMAASEAETQVPSLKKEDLTKSTDRRRAFYKDLALNPGYLRGFATGYAVIDRATRGVQPEQYIVIAGPPKSAKSTLLMDIGITMNTDHNAKVLLVSFEMSAEEQGARYDAMGARINYNKLMEGRLSAKETRKLNNALDDQVDYPAFILSTDISAMTTVSGIRAQVAQEKPDVVLIDGLYLMQDEHGERMGSSQALTNISRGIKRMAQATKIPVIATTQALESKISKSLGMSSASIGYSSAFAQDCDVLLGVEPDKEQPGATKLQVLLSRSGPKAATSLVVDWSTSTITEQDVPEEDADGDEKRSGGSF